MTQGTRLRHWLTGGFDVARLPPSPRRMTASTSRAPSETDTKVTQPTKPTLLDRVPSGSSSRPLFHGSKRRDEGADGVAGVEVVRARGGGRARRPSRGRAPAVRRPGRPLRSPGLPIPEVTLALVTDDAGGGVTTSRQDRPQARRAGRDDDGRRVPAHRLAWTRCRPRRAAFEGTLPVSTGPNALADFAPTMPSSSTTTSYTQATDRVELGDSTAGLVYVDVQRMRKHLVDGIATAAGEGRRGRARRNLAPIGSFVGNASADGERRHVARLPVRPRSASLRAAMAARAFRFTLRVRHRGTSRQDRRSDLGLRSSTPCSRTTRPAASPARR